MAGAVTVEKFVELAGPTIEMDLFKLPNEAGTLCVAKHQEIGMTEMLHYHTDPHLTLMLNGGVIDKRKGTEADRVASGLMFFQTGELHKTVNKLFPTKYVSLTFDF